MRIKRSSKGSNQSQKNRNSKKINDPILVRKSKPPDQLRTIKCNFNNLIIDDEVIDTINDAIKRSNSLYTHSCYFMRSYILYKYENNQDIPEINDKFIKMVIKCLSKDSKADRPPSADSAILLADFNTFYKKYYKKNGIH